MRPVTPQTRAISSIISTASKTLSAGATVLLWNGVADQTGLREFADIFPGVGLSMVDFRGLAAHEGLRYLPSYGLKALLFRREIEQHSIPRLCDN